MLAAPSPPEETQYAELGLRFVGVKAQDDAPAAIAADPAAER
jgi:hypothetical protein